jgi:hypothetical protein
MDIPPSLLLCCRCLLLPLLATLLDTADIAAAAY